MQKRPLCAGSLDSHSNSMKIRKFKISDVDQIAQLFHDTIRQVNIKDYSEQQVKAWAPDDIFFRDWDKVCSQKYTFVAEDDGIITGFAELETDGHIDCFYCHKDFQQQGIGKSLFRRLEEKAEELQHARMYAEVSITAKPFFLKMGFSVLKQQEIATRGEKFTNYIMEKYLKPAG